MTDWGAVFKHLREGVVSPFFKRAYRPFLRNNRGGFEVIDADWDYLIVLDACRYDIFRELNEIKGRLSKVRSKGSATPEWLRSNFTNFYDNIVYVSSNPYVSPLDNGDFRSDEHFPVIYPLYLKDELLECDTVPPEEVTKEAIKTKEEHPSKRMIIHYMQPHMPYIGDIHLGNEHQEKLSKKFGREKVVKAYKDNLRRVLQSTKNLIYSLKGKIVITADHGEMLGEYLCWGHRVGVYFDELVEVPWLEVAKR